MPRVPMNRRISRALIYAAVLFIGVFLFFFLHYLSNQLDFDFAKQKLNLAFERKNLTNVTFFGRAYPLKSVQTLNGLDPYPECEVLLSVLEGAEGSGSQRSALQKMIQPNRVQSVSYPSFRQNCNGLEAIVVYDDDFGYKPLKSRYWWGVKAVYGILLRYLEVFEIRYLFQATIYFSYLLLAVALTAFSTRVAIIFGPFIFFGVFLSGIPFFSGAPVAPAYILSILTGAVMVLLIRRQVSPQTLNLASFIVGMFSSYFWILDAHTMVILSLLPSIVYFSYRVHASPSKSAKCAVSCALLYATGFVTCYVLGQLIKAAFLGWGQVYGTAMYQALFHLGHFGSRKGDGLQVLPYFFHISMLGPVLGQMFTGLSLLALLTAAYLSINQSIKARRTDLLLDFLLPLGLILLVYVRVLFGNDSAYYTARFVFVIYALAWASLLALLVNPRYGDNSRAAPKTVN